MRLPLLSSCDREDYLLDRCQGQAVLHLGCADWPLTRARLRDGTLLHARLARVTDRLWGADVSREGIGLLAAAGYRDLVAFAGTDGLAAALGRTFDRVVAGEILEHLDDPGRFLAGLRGVCHPGTLLLLTVPNFAALKRLPRLLWREETVHPDHRAYYSVVTVTRLCQEQGFRRVEVLSYWGTRGRFAFLLNPLCRRVPFLQALADGFCFAFAPGAAGGGKAPPAEGGGR